jgi:PIN like domain
MLTKVFEHFRPLSEDEKRDLRQTGVVVLDTNVLLELYRLGPTARDSVVNALNTYFTGRLWIPYHVGLEFFRNRTALIEKDRNRVNEQLDQALDLQKQIRTFSESRDLAELGLTLDWKTLGNSACEPLATAAKSLKESQAGYPNLRETDTVLRSLEELLGARIGKPPVTQKEVDDWQVEGDRRYPLQIPPGYRDENQKKDGEFSDRGLVYKRKFGDWFVWRQLLNEVKCSTDDFSKVLFVTSDLKEDWWEKVGKEFVGPRPELRFEIQQAGAKLFHMYKLSRLLERMDADHPMNALPTSAINELKKSEQEGSSPEIFDNNIDFLELDEFPRSFSSGPRELHSDWRDKTDGDLGFFSQRAVHDWLRTQNPRALIHLSKNFPDIVVAEPRRGLLDGLSPEHGYQVVTPKTPPHLSAMSRRLISKAASWMEDEDFIERDLTFVVTLHKAAIERYGSEQWMKAISEMRFTANAIRANVIDGVLMNDRFYPI